jgi:hypothetical protein
MGSWLSVPRHSQAPHSKDAPKNRSTQKAVTWDTHSPLINGQRIMIFSGEFHPFRLPVPSLWPNVFQKIKALGLNTVSFYKTGPFWKARQAASAPKECLTSEHPWRRDSEHACILLPGLVHISVCVFMSESTSRAWQQTNDFPLSPIPQFPHSLDAEPSGGGLPGWLQRLKGHLRTTDNDYLASLGHSTLNPCSSDRWSFARIGKLVNTLSPKPLNLCFLRRFPFNVSRTCIDGSRYSKSRSIRVEGDFRS